MTALALFLLCQFYFDIILTQKDNAVIETRNGGDTSQSLVAGGWWLVLVALLTTLYEVCPHVISSALHLSTSPVWKLGTLQSLILRGSWRQEAAVQAAVLQCCSSVQFAA